MIIGVPKELKNNESRVALTPDGVFALVSKGHRVIVQHDAGIGSGISNEAYVDAGAMVERNVRSLYDASDMIVKVKEPIEEEYEYYKKNQILFTYLHLAADEKLTQMLLEKEITAVAYETVQLSNGKLPLLAPMSDIAGRMSVIVAANHLQTTYGGTGLLMSGVVGVEPAHVVIIGGGNVGTNAAKIALGMRARVTILDINRERLGYLDDIFDGKVSTIMTNEYNVTKAVKEADVLISSVLIPGHKAPKIVTEAMVKQMKKGSIIVDVAIDQGGSVETITHATTHDNPVYEKYGVIHYSVANMPGSMARTSTYALTSVTLEYIEKLAVSGVKAALIKDIPLQKGLNCYKGSITNQDVAQSLNREYRSFQQMLEREG